MSDKLNQKGSLKMLLRYVKPYTAYLILALIFTAISVLASLYTTVLIGDAVDYLVGKDRVDFEKIHKIVNYLIILIAVVFLSQYLEKVITNKLSFSIARDLRQDLILSISKAPLSFVDSHYHGEVISRVISDVTEISNGLLMGFTQFFNGIITIIATLVFLITLNVSVAVLVVALTPISFFVAGFLAKRTFKLFKEQSKKRGELTAMVEETTVNQKLLKAFTKEDEKEKEFSVKNEDLRDKSTKATYYSAIVNPTTRFINNVVYMIVTLFGAYMVIFGGVFAGAGFTVGMMTSCLLYANKYTKPFNEISSVVTELQSALASSKRVFEIINMPREVEDKEDAIVLEEPKGLIKMQDVSFSYDKNKELIKGLNLDVKSGQRVAIVGKTGSGKTTLINLLMRFYDVDGGSIMIDGKDVRDYTRKSLRSNFGMVLQDPFVMHGTIRDNIAYGKADATKEEVIFAAKSARIHNLIMHMPNGYDTVISDSSSLSGGFKQLICIARVMLILPPMLILDEATSSIDTRTEQKVQQAFDMMMEGRTTFVVAHRLSTIKHADVILYIENGKVKEQGTHEELLNKNGAYAALYKSQFTI